MAKIATSIVVQFKSTSNTGRAALIQNWAKECKGCSQVTSKIVISSKLHTQEGLKNIKPAIEMITNYPDMPHTNDLIKWVSAFERKHAESQLQFFYRKRAKRVKTGIKLLKLFSEQNSLQFSKSNIVAFLGMFIKVSTLCKQILSTAESLTALCCINP